MQDVIFIDPKKVPVLFSCLVTASFLNLSQPVVNTLGTWALIQMSQNIRFCVESYLNQGLLIFHDSKNLPRFLGGLQGVSDIESAWSELSKLAALDDVKPNDYSLDILLGSVGPSILCFPMPKMQ